MKLFRQESRNAKAEVRGEHRLPGVWLGIDRGSHQPVVLSERELNQHTFLVGTTGSGKTTTIESFMEYAMERGMPLVLVDGKGDLDFAERVRKLSLKFERPYKAFCLGDPEQSAHYNPLVSGGPTELKDRLIALSEWTEPHYQYMAERYLQMAFILHERAGRTNLDLPTLVYEGLTSSALIALAQQIQAPPYILEYLEGIDPKEIQGLLNRLAVVVESQVGHLFADESENTLTLPDVIQTGGVALFSLDSLAYPLYASLLGRLVINDLKAAASKRKASDGLVMTIYDEFNVFASRAVVDFINKSRGKGFAALIATQSLADLDVVDASLKKQIIQNCNTVIVQRQNDPSDAETLAAVIGTENIWDTTHQISEDGHTGLGSTRLTKEYIAHPDLIKRLTVGEAFVVRKIPEFQTHYTKIRQVEV